jgi:hypothetical protein
MGPRGRLAAAPALLVLSVVATTAAGASGPPPGPVRDCTSRAETSRPLRFGETGDALRLGPVELRGIRGWRTARSVLTTRRDGVFHVKVLPVVRARARVTIAVAAGAKRFALLDYDDTGGPTPAVTFVACPADEPSRVRTGSVGPATSFPGEFVLRRPACVPIEVWTAGRTVPLRARLRLGRACG